MAASDSNPGCRQAVQRNMLRLVLMIAPLGWKPQAPRLGLQQLQSPADSAYTSVQGIMLRLALAITLLGAASAAIPQARIEQARVERDSIETATNRLLRGGVSAEAEVRIENVLNALGSSNVTNPTAQYNPDLPDQAPPVQVPAVQPAPWHVISRPPNAICAVSHFAHLTTVQRLAAVHADQRVSSSLASFIMCDL